MTVNKLYHMLTQLIAQGHGRRPVCVDKATFRHNCEADGITILEVCGAAIIAHGMDDGDGGRKLRTDGSEVERLSLVLWGGAKKEEAK